jgi:hypothetical protein
MQSAIPTTGAAPGARYRWLVDRQAIARARRREQALEQLAFEREREEALREQLHEIVTEQLGAQVDEEAFAAMSAEDVEVVRAALGQDEAESIEEDRDESPLWADEDGEEEDVESELARLESELQECGRRQRALERYVEALAVSGGQTPGHGRNRPGSTPGS